MNSRGFTLIELMIVIAILAIIVAIALPSYNRHVEKTRRADAQSSLLDTAQRLERCFTRTNSYTDCITFPLDSAEDFYQITAPTLTATTYTLRATAVANGPQAGDACSPFTLDHLGNRTPVGTNDRCWGSN